MMKGLFLVMVAGVLLAPVAAGARDWGFIPTLQAAQGDMKKGGGGQAQRGGQEQRRDKESPPPPRDERHHGRMTDDERRELHRDLDRANREIYRQKGR